MTTAHKIFSEMNKAFLTDTLLFITFNLVNGRHFNDTLVELKNGIRFDNNSNDNGFKGISNQIKSPCFLQSGGPADVPGHLADTDHHLHPLVLPYQADYTSCLPQD